MIIIILKVLIKIMCRKSKKPNKIIFKAIMIVKRNIMYQIVFKKMGLNLNLNINLNLNTEIIKEILTKKI